MTLSGMWQIMPVGAGKRASAWTPQREELAGRDARRPASPLQQAAAAWRRLGGEEGLLLHGETLVEAETWAAAHEGELGEDELDFLGECREAEAHRARQRRLADLIRCLASVVSVVALIGFGLALSWRTEQASLRRGASEVQAQLEAEREAKLAVERALAEEIDARREAETANEEMAWDLRATRASALAERAGALSRLCLTTLPEDRELAILLGVEAVRLATASGYWGQSLDEARLALHRAVGHLGWQEGTNTPELNTRPQRAWLSPDGRALAVYEHGLPTLWDAATGQSLGALEDQLGQILAADWAADERRLALADQDGRIAVWETSPPALVRRIESGMRVAGIRWCPVGTRLLTVGGGRVVVWDMDSATPLFSWAPSEGMVVSARWADGGRLVRVDLASDEGVVLDGREGTELLRYLGDPSGVSPSTCEVDVRIEPARDGTDLLHLVAASDLAQVACTRVSRNLTQAEWAQYVGNEVPYRQTCAQWPAGE